MEGLSTFSDPMVVSLDDLHGRRPRLTRRTRRRCSTSWWPSRTPDDLAILVYTSGTTGPPKGAMHSHRNVVCQMRHCMHPELSLTWYEGDERLAFLPLCHVAERIAGSYYSVATGVCSNFAESPETVPDNIREVQPTLFGAVPRVWEKFYSGITIALKDATPIQQWAYRRAIDAGFAVADARLARRAPSAFDKLRFQLGLLAGAATTSAA